MTEFDDPTHEAMDEDEDPQEGESSESSSEREDDAADQTGGRYGGAEDFEREDPAGGDRGEPGIDDEATGGGGG
jgi:hypothetical protein